MASNPPCAPPDAGSLHQAALSHLARYAATEAGLRRVLVKRVDRWARLQTDPEAAAPAAAAARQAIDGVIEQLLRAGAVSDAAFAENRARSLVRGGQSNRAVQARLVAKGVAPDLARAASVSDAGTELAAALVLVRKRRIGAYRRVGDVDANPRVADEADPRGGDEADPRGGDAGARGQVEGDADTRRKELGLLARAGFSRDIAEQALAMSREEAERRIFELRR